MTSVNIYSDKITLPNEVIKLLSIKDGDELDVSIKQGSIILKPKPRIKDIKKKVSSLTGMIGQGKGAFSSPEEVDDFIRNERNQWD